MLERTDGDPCCAFEARLLYSDAAAEPVTVVSAELSDADGALNLALTLELDDGTTETVTLSL